MDKDGENRSLHEEATKTRSAPLQRDGYDIKIEVDENNIITFTGQINPKHYAGKAVNQIWSAMYKSARALANAWERNTNE